MEHDFEGVRSLLVDYFDGLHHSDTARLRAVFDDDAHYVCATPGNHLRMGMAEYFAVVDRRPSPASRGEPRRDRIDAIAFAGPEAAFARVRCAIGPKLFTDFLMLVRAGGRWRIVSKVFHYDLEPEAATAP